MDKPKSLANAAVREARLEALGQPHIAPLTAFVRELRARMGADYAIPYFDPEDGGIHADCLFLLEAPGPKAVQSGFISRNNPDETARNFFLLNEEAGINRTRTVTWNIVPWYVGSGSKIRAANKQDIRSAEEPLRALLSLLPSLHSIVLVGRKATLARESIASLAPAVELLTMPHPSPMFVNRSPANRERILTALREIGACLPPPARVA